MAEQSEPYDTPPIMPSISRDLEPPGRKVDRKLQHMDSVLTQLDLALGALAQAMLRCDPPLTAMILDSFTLENGPRATISPDKVLPENQDKRYYVQLKQGRRGS